MDYITTMPRDAQERKGKIRTFTGLYVNPLSMRPEDICIEDIAHHLSNECRYSGACPEHYSVAQHSVLVSRQFDGDTEMALAGLLHDAEEAYLKDMASPVKHDPRMAWYRQVGRDLNRMIFEKFRIDPELEPRTKPADDELFRQETQSWWGKRVVVFPWGPARAERAFLQRFHDLVRLR